MVVLVSMHAPRVGKYDRADDWPKLAMLAITVDDLSKGHRQ